MNIGQLPTRHAAYRPDHLAVVFGDTRLTYREYNKRINQSAHALLAMGIRKGDKVATLLPNGLEPLEIYWAGAKIGAVIIPLSPLLRAQAIATLLTDSDTTTLITNRSMVETINEVRQNVPTILPERYLLTDASDQAGYGSYHDLTGKASDQEPTGIEIADDDPYNIMYSSGTTGQATGIVHTHYMRSLYGTLFTAAFRITPESIVLHSGSLVFNGAFVMLMSAMFTGATFVLMPNADPVPIISTISRERVTHIFTVPSQIIALCNAANFSLEALRSVIAQA